MIALIQRIRNAEVWIKNQCISKVGKGILLFAAVAQDDSVKDVAYVANKTVNLRIFGDEKGNLNRSLIDIGGEILVVSQFTLLGDTRKGRRPSFTRAAAQEEAEKLYRLLIDELRNYDVTVKEGRFREMMDVKLINDGPVTLIVNSKDKRP